MSSFDAVDQIFQQSLDLLEQITGILLLNDQKTILGVLQKEYRQLVTNLLIKFKNTKTTSEIDQTELLVYFYGEIERIKLPNKLNDVLDRINDVIRPNAAAIKPELKACLDRFNKLPKYETLEKPMEEILRCTCGESMTRNQAVDEFECVCGVVKNSDVSLYEDVCYIEGCIAVIHKTNYQKAGHSYKWLMQSQARENFDLPRDVKIKILKQFLVESIYDIRQVNCPTMRRCLKALGLTEYNSHIPHLIKETTSTKNSPGKMPFQLTQLEFDDVINEVIKNLEILGEKEDGNSPYHPFLLMKTIEEYLPEQTKHERYRKANIILYFHIQTENTLNENDRLWKFVCDHRPNDYAYRATDVDKYKLWAGILM